jgi:hypothetical protein
LALWPQADFKQQIAEAKLVERLAAELEVEEEAEDQTPPLKRPKRTPTA